MEVKSFLTDRRFHSQKPDSSEDIVRVLRVIEYTGPRSSVERQISNSIHGTLSIPVSRLFIRAATIGEYPEILEKVTSDTNGR